ncbi:DNA methyltransferase [Bradyrhizobium sp. STM 3562]|uniref:DNA methyltransferase n=1 Tax=Bradyrhizobium sp. STM 3562 TaxID=578924 RepID=UPI00388DBC2F
MTSEVDGLPETLTAPRTDPVYNCHAYLTKVPIAAIRPFIETFTVRGETVADIFAGSGMTGLAAATLGRRAQLSDISVLGRHIAIGYLTEVDGMNFSRVAKDVIDRARLALGDLYLTERNPDRAKVEMVRTVWSFTYHCPGCDRPLVFFKAMRNGRTAAPDKCPHCSESFVRRIWKRGPDVPVQVVVRDSTGRLADQEVGESDFDAIAKAKSDTRQHEVPSRMIDESREMFSRSGLGKAGLVETKQFFSPRNAIALLELWRAIQAVNEQSLRAKLSFAFTAILPRASRRYQWSAQRPLNAQNQTYYIAPVYYEWNVFELFERKVEAAIRAGEFLFGSEPLFSSEVANVNYALCSADHLSHLDDASVDYIFTDPPFGSNIFYSDMNLFQEAWLGQITDHAREAVMHTTGRKKAGAAKRYEEILRGAFAEAFRILKPGRYMTVVFGNSNGRVWALVQRAMRAAGFQSAPVHVAILDKGQRSVKGLNSGSEGVVTVDLVVTLQKPVDPSKSGADLIQADPRALIRKALDSIPETMRSPSYIYATIVRDAIKRHQMLDHLHLSDVLIALRDAGYTIDAKKGLLVRDNQQIAVAAE